MSDRRAILKAMCAVFFSCHRGNYNEFICKHAALESSFISNNGRVVLRVNFMLCADVA